jgi:hypothetical protein
MTFIVASLPPRHAVRLQRLSCELPEAGDSAGLQDFREFVDLANELEARAFYREDS